MVRIPVGGMETSLFLFCSVTAVMLFCNQRFLLAAVLGAIGYFLRPEALLLLGVFWGMILVKRQFRNGLFMTLIEMAIIVPPLLIFWYYYGNPFPHSVTVKALELHGSLLTILRDEFFLNPLHIVALPFAVWGAVLSGKSSRFLHILTVWCGVYFLVYLIMRPHCWGWYFYAPYFVKFLLTAVGGVDLIHRCFRRVRLTPVSLALIGGLLVVISGAAIAIKAGRSPVMRYVYTPLGTWFKEHPALGESIVAGDIGAIGYYSRAYIYDLNGLVTSWVSGSATEKTKK